MNTYMSQPTYNHPINGLSKKFECPFDGCFHTFDIKAVSDFVDENVKQYLKKHIDSLPGNEYGKYVSSRTLLQPAAQQVERVQCDDYEMDVYKCKLFQTAAQ